MREPTYLIIVALAVLVAPPFSAFAQREERGPPRLEEQTPLRKPEQQIPLRKPQEQTPPRTQTFGGHVYHGQLAWRDGRWHHTTRNGRDGWWWDVGGYLYYYPEQIEGPPDYVSGVEVADDTTTAAPSASRSPSATSDWVSPPATSDSPSPPATSDSPSPPAKIWISPQ
jgi:hypothetical protein